MVRSNSCSCSGSSVGGYQACVHVLLCSTVQRKGTYLTEFIKQYWVTQHCCLLHKYLPYCTEMLSAIQQYFTLYMQATIHIWSMYQFDQLYYNIYISILLQHEGRGSWHALLYCWNVWCSMKKPTNALKPYTLFTDHTYMFRLHSATILWCTVLKSTIKKLCVCGKLVSPNPASLRGTYQPIQQEILRPTDTTF
jgi:hypothetical protein